MKATKTSCVERRFRIVVYSRTLKLQGGSNGRYWGFGSLLRDGTKRDNDRFWAPKKQYFFFLNLGREEFVVRRREEVEVIKRVIAQAIVKLTE